MGAYVHGNVARKEQVIPQRPTVKQASRAVVRSKAISKQEKLLYLFTVIVLAVLASAILWRYAQIYEMNAQIHQIQNEIRALQAENSILKERIDRANDPNELRNSAAKFGLAPLVEENKVRIPDRSATAKASAGQVALKK